MAEDASVRVLVVDDTVLYRKILSEAVKGVPDATVTATAASGAIALRKMAHQPVDAVLLDIFMPDMDGVETLTHIRERFPDVPVIMVSGATTRDAAITIKALELGALDFIPKPKSASPSEAIAELSAVLRPLLRQVQIRLLAHAVRWGEPSGEPPSEAVGAAHFAPLPSRFRIVLIAVSTGGPNALAQVLPALPAAFPAPILVVQHMPAVFTKSLAEHLGARTRLAVREAVEGDLVEAGTILIAQGGKHMILRRGQGPVETFRVGMNLSPPVNSCRPSADVLFRSAAATLQGKILAVVLTGMGDDGAHGVAAMKRRGCYCIAQTEDTCVVYGMPRAVVEAGLADEVLPLSRIAGRITSLVME